MKKLLIAAIAVLLLPFVANAQFSISGTVSQKGSTTLLPGTTIRIRNTSNVTKTDSQGHYDLSNLKAGTYTIIASYVGFNTVQQTLTLQADLNLNLELSAAAFLADEVIVNATRANEKSATTYKNLSKEDIRQNNFGQDLPFILNNTPGVVVTSDAGAGVGYTGIRIRGSDATRVNVTLNGIPYNDSESQGTFWVNMPDFASSVDNIQIQRGVGTSTNGAGAFGASLNIQTTTPSAEPYAELNNTYGSFNTLKNTVKIGTGLIDNKFSFDGRLSRIKSDGFVDRGASDLKSYFLSGAYQGERDVLRINVFAGTEKTYQSWNGISEETLLQGDRTYNSFTYKNQTDNYWQNHYQMLYAHQFSDQFSFNGALHYTKGRGYYEEYKEGESFSAYGLQNVTVGGTVIEETDLIRRRWLDNNFYGATYNFTYKPSNALNITLGGAYNKYNGDHFGEIIWAQYASNSVYGNHYYDNTGKKTDFNVFGKIVYSPVEHLSLFADLQYRNVDYSVLGTEKALNQLNIKDNLGFFNPKVGATYFLNKESNIYASLSVANKEPIRDDYVNAAVGELPKSERLNNIELGYRIKKERFNAGLNVYGMFYKDQLVLTGKQTDVGEPLRQNVDQSYRLGVELDASYTISKQFAVNANAALSRNKIKNYLDYLYEYDDNYNVINTVTTPYKSTNISFSPSAVLFGELVYKPISGFAIALQNKYVGKQYLDNTQNESRKLKAYYVGNFRAGYDFTAFGIKNINLGLLVNNIFDKKYESNGYTYGSIYQGVASYSNFYFPQAGTNFLLSLNLKF
ncbi:TonB-dependent receptor [Pedobacter duraquae]|uniref:Iron complex outermembrane receptor protein n=1 Tax=Pedobacter duraquae TaxID=425511 RepID=A0A4R6IGA8_9SPHI|nr:TonB-dependent receptor [Pedobacter duraquae]TDO21393.1 iron complex outermembrane receptor protein [Pedobacter duraquae]